MHQSSMSNMRRFVADYLAVKKGEVLSIADIGSQDVNGSYRAYFQEPGWSYTGVDMAPGKNVDVVLKDIYNWSELQSASFDAVVSGQALEHIEYFWETMREISRIMRPGALCCLIAPSGGFEHRYPVDCWRFYPDGMRALARYVGLEVLEAYAQWDKEKYPDMDPVWQDCVLVAQKKAVADTAVRLEHLPSTRSVDSSLKTSSESFIRSWYLDNPKTKFVELSGTDDKIEVRGWVLGVESASVQLAIRLSGLTRCYPLNEARPDVVTKVLNEVPANHPKLICGFRYTAAISGRVELGFESNGRLVWLTTIEAK